MDLDAFAGEASNGRHDVVRPLAPEVFDPYAAADPAVVEASLADAVPEVYWTDPAQRPMRPDPRPVLHGAAVGLRLPAVVALPAVCLLYTSRCV